MPTIQLQFVSDRTLASEAIEVFERGWASHVDSVVNGDIPWAPNGTLVGARLAGGVKARPPGYATWSRAEVVSIDCTQIEHIAYWDFISEQIGKPYDLWAIAAFAVDRDWRTPDSWFCDELIARGLEVAGIVRPLAVQAHRLDVRDLYLVVSAIADAAG